MRERVGRAGGKREETGEEACRGYSWAALSRLIQANSVGTLVSRHVTHPKFCHWPQLTQLLHHGGALQSMEKAQNGSWVWPNHFQILALRLVICAISQLPAQRFPEDPSTQEGFVALGIPLKSLFKIKFICLVNLTPGPSVPHWGQP